MEKQMKKQFEMAYLSYDKLLRSEFHKKFSAKGRVQDVSINHLKHKVNDSYQKDTKLTTNFEPSDDPVIVGKLRAKVI